MENIQKNGKTALVLGARGGVGGEIARQLRDAGWQVRALQRGLESPTLQRSGMSWMRGDALMAQDVARAAAGCSLIVHAVNPPGYRNWDTQVLPMMDNTIAARALPGPQSCCRARSTTTGRKCSRASRKIHLSSR